MIKIRHKPRKSIIKFLYIVIDTFCIYGAIFLACFIRQKVLTFPVSITYLVEQNNPYQFLFLSWIVTTVFFANANNLYETRRELLEGVEVWLVLKSVFLASLVTIVAIFVFKIQTFPRSVFLIGAISIFILLVVWRIAKRWFVEYLVVRGYNNMNALIVGAGKIGVALAGELGKRPGLGIKVVGFLDDFKKDLPQRELRVLGRISDFVKVSRREFIDKVFITIHHDSQVFLDLLEQARVLGIAVRVVPQGFDLTTGELFKYNIGIIPVLEYLENIMKRKQTGKRLFDFVVSFITTVCLIPIFIIVALLIKRDSKGSVFYVSRRYGRNGRIFKMFKFRTMVKDAEQVINQLRDKNEKDGPIFKMRRDPRITRFGRFLRKYSLDELPQILNVLRGEMSLVGPRPLPIEQIEKEDLRQLKRLEIRPGITGLWQIRGRSDISFSRLVKWDIWYINNWSFWLDLNILFQTIPVVVKGRGAY